MKFMYQKKEAQKEQNKSMQKGSAVPSGTGLSREMKEKYESFSGFSFDDVRVHYNSSMPAQMQALAYTQGNHVYLMPGQERHLDHELGHVIQQKKGIVKPTGTIGGIPVNEDEALEAEASMYGRQAQNSFAGKQNIQKGRSGPVAQRYKKAGGYTLAAGPGQPPGKRLLMVKDNEPGSLYIHETVIDDQVPRELGKLGIKPGNMEVDSPLPEETPGETSRETPVETPEETPGETSRETPVETPEETPEETPGGRFKRYEQKQIPNIAEKELTQEEIPRDQLTLWQKIFSCCAPWMRDVYQTQWDNAQPTRKPADRELAEARLERQSNFLNSCLQDGAALYDLIRSHVPFQQDQVDLWNGHLQELSQDADEEQFISLYALGSDVRNDIRAIHGVAAQEWEQEREQEQAQEQAEDHLLVLEIAMEDLRYRLDQVGQEIMTVRYMPQIPTACDTSASVRSMLIDEGHKERRSAKACFNIDRNNPFWSLVGWTYHFATPIPADALTNDMLIIEDAVGKSSSSMEVMNAHWAAHIYGNEEGDNTSGIALDNPQSVEVPRTNADPQRVLRGVSRCRFNQMSDIFRRKFCDDHNITSGQNWSMKYRRYDTNNTFGKLKFYMDENCKIGYELEPKQNQNFFTPGMQHFLISTADAIAEDFVLQSFAGEDDEMHMSVVGIQPRQSPETRYDARHHPLEEFMAISRLG